MKKKIKPKTTAIILLSLVLLFAAYDRYFIKDDLSSCEIQNDSLKQELLQLDSIKQELISLKEFKKYGISIGDTTIQAVTNLKIQNKDYMYLHIDKIVPGKNYFYYVLRENVAVELWVMKNLEK